MTNRVVLWFLILALSLFLPSGGPALADEQKPVLALIKEGGWVLYTGPDFVLYESGLVLYKRRSDLFPPEYHAANLTREEIQHLFDTLSLPKGFLALDDMYELTHVTDQVTNWIFLWGAVNKTVGAYGYIPIPYRQREGYKPPPPAFLRVFERLDTFDHPLAHRWTPFRVEVRVFPMPRKMWIENAIPWPAHWPSLDDPVVKKPSSEVYLFYVAGDDLALLRTLMPNVGNEHLVQSGDMQYKVQYHPLVPSERLIADALRKARQ